MEKISRIGMDTSKRIVQLRGVNSAEQAVLRKKLPHDRMVAFSQGPAANGGGAGSMRGVAPLGARACGNGRSSQRFRVR